MAKPKKKDKAPKISEALGAAGITKSSVAPLCTALLFCDQVIIGKDNTCTLVRVVDIVGIPPTEAETRKEGDFVEIPSVTMFASLKVGDAQGKVNLLILGEDPSGKTTPLGAAIMNMEGTPEKGGVMVSPLRVCWGGEGLYWIRLTVNNVEIAKTPVVLKIGGVPEASPST